MINHRLLYSRTLILFAVLTLTGCESLEGFLAGTVEETAPVVVPIEDRPVQEPLDNNRFTLLGADQTVVGEPQIVFASAEDTFSDLARTYGLGYDELVAANPDINPWLPGEGTPVLLPTQYILPDAPQEGVILNIATKRLYYYPEPLEDEERQVLTYPIGIGRVGWETPLGETTVIDKTENPSWWVPASVRREHAEMGDPLPKIVPPGPDNPLGTRVLKLDMPGYLIHGTNQPYGVGMRVSHGCVRLYPENIEYLYTLVNVGESVTIVNEPYQSGERDGRFYFEAHAPLEDDEILPQDRLQDLLDRTVDDEGRPLRDSMQQHVALLAEDATGVAVSIIELDKTEVMARARVVHNIVERDPNEPTLSEVRELMDAADEETDETQTK